MVTGVVSWILVGLIVGWLSGRRTKSSGSDLFADITLGIAGAVIGGWIFGRLGGFPFGGLIGTIVTAFAGSIIFLLILWFARMNKKAS